MYKGKVKSCFCAMALCIGMIPSMVHATEPDFFYACVRRDTYIYAEESPNSEKIATLEEGDVCRVLGEEGCFYRVFSGGFTGYVEQFALTDDHELLGEIRSHDGVAADEDTYVYSSPSRSSQIIAERRKGATETITGDGIRNDGWIEVQVVVDDEGTLEVGFMHEDSVTPERIVRDAEPFMQPCDEITISSDRDVKVEAAKALRRKAEEITQQVKRERTSKKNYDVPVEKGILNPRSGTVLGPSGKETYYNLSMHGVVKVMRKKGFSEEEYPYWVREDGVKMLGDYIMCAADLNIRPRGSLVESSLGTCIVTDTGDFIYTNPYQIDIAVDW